RRAERARRRGGAERDRRNLVGRRRCTRRDAARDRRCRAAVAFPRNAERGGGAAAGERAGGRRCAAAGIAARLRPRLKTATPSMSQPTEPDDGGPQETFISHLIELRSRLLRSIVAVVIVLVCLVPFAKDIYAELAAPLVRALPKGATMIA